VNVQFALALEFAWGRSDAVDQATRACSATKNRPDFHVNPKHCSPFHSTSRLDAQSTTGPPRLLEANISAR